MSTPEQQYTEAYGAAIDALAHGEDPQRAARQAICPTREIAFVEKVIARLACDRAVKDWKFDHRERQT